MRKFLLTLMICTALGACANTNGIRLAAPDFGDAGTTAYALSSGGFVEQNPIVAWSGQAAPVLGLGLKYAAKTALHNVGYTAHQSNILVESGSMFGTCANFATILGVVPPVSYVIGGICLLDYYNTNMQVNSN